MSAPAQRASQGRHRAHAARAGRLRKVGGMATGFVVAAAVTGTAAWAVLSATASNTSPQTVGSGLLSISLTDASPSGGFSSAIAGMLPGDTVNRFVTVTNGTGDAQGLTLGVTGTGSTKLTTDATNGLKVTVTSCGVPWSSGSCASPTTLVSSAAIAGFGTKSLVAGAWAANSVQYLRVGLTLPDQVETTVNGTPNVSPTIQGLTTGLTWTFTETQRTGATTNS